jgi:hypothetical protein
VPALTTTPVVLCQLEPKASLLQLGFRTLVLLLDLWALNASPSLAQALDRFLTKLLT